jgi:pimeloyl-ACP methyl ester carboxylesterase
MGAGVGLLFAGTFPEKVGKLVMIEGLGPVTADAEKCAKNLRRSIEAERKYQLKAAESQGGGTSKIYTTFAEAVDARVRSVATYPGEQSLSVEAATALVSRLATA